MRRLVTALALAAISTSAMGQGAALPTAADVAAARSAAAAASATASTAAATASAAQVAAAAACVAKPSVPPMEMVGGAAGSISGGCRPADSIQPRITRVRPFVTGSDGSVVVTFADIGTTDYGLTFSVGQNLSDQAVPSCNYVIGTLTRTSVQVVCNVTQSILGLGLLPTKRATAGVQGTVTALPNTPAS